MTGAAATSGTSLARNSSTKAQHEAGGQPFGAHDVRGPHPCALRKGAVLEVSPGTLHLRALSRRVCARTSNLCGARLQPRRKWPEFKSALAAGPSNEESPHS